MDRRVCEVIRILPSLIFSPPPSNLQTTNNGDGIKESLLLDHLAQSVNLSRSRLRALVKAETGMTFKQQIKNLRIEKAKALAETTHLTISQILAEVGAGDESHFRREFKKALGKTLSECQKLCVEQTEEEYVGKDNDQNITRNHFGQHLVISVRK
jgi:AraC-like DNA-binding protein